MSLFTHFENFVKQNHLFQKNDLLLLTVSGGRDSVSLCELCHRCGFNFEIAHCNFQLRGEESMRDEGFVKNLAAQYGAPVHVVRFDTKKYSEGNKISIQVAARELRYKWFDELSNELKKKNSRVFIVTAHHANDNIETLLINFLKGTGIDGLQGIPVKNKNIVRPLLFAKREEINEFVNENNLQFVEDSSNLLDKYTRNYIRLQLIPSIKKIIPAVEDNLIGNINRFQDIKNIYEESIEEICNKIVEKKGNECHIPVLKLLKRKGFRAILFEIIKGFNFSSGQLEEVVKLLYADSGKFVLSETHRIIRDRKWLIIVPAKSDEANHILINKNDNRIVYQEGEILLKENKWNKGEKIPSESDIAILDANEILFPLILRPWKRGDYFYPLGMDKKKKLSRFFVDLKLSIVDKEKVWVLESNKKILWVIGLRIDNRFKVTEKTKSVLTIAFNKSETTDPSSYSSPDK